MPHPVKTHEWRTKASVSPGSIISHWATHQTRLSWFNQKLVMSLQNVEIRKHSGNYMIPGIDIIDIKHIYINILHIDIDMDIYIYIKYMHMHVHIPKHDLATFASIPLVYHRHQRVAPLQPPTSSLRLPRKRYIYIYIHVYIYTCLKVDWWCELHLVSIEIRNSLNIRPSSKTARLINDYHHFMSIFRHVWDPERTVALGPGARYGVNWSW